VPESRIDYPTRAGAHVDVAPEDALDGSAMPSADRIIGVDQGGDVPDAVTVTSESVDPAHDLGLTGVDPSLSI
jgi:hypothetical protein